MRRRPRASRCARRRRRRWQPAAPPRPARARRCGRRPGAPERGRGRSSAPARERQTEAESALLQSDPKRKRAPLAAESERPTARGEARCGCAAQYAARGRAHHRRSSARRRLLCGNGGRRLRSTLRCALRMPIVHSARHQRRRRQLLPPPRSRGRLSAPRRAHGAFGAKPRRATGPNKGSPAARGRPRPDDRALAALLRPAEGPGARAQVEVSYGFVPPQERGATA